MNPDVLFLALSLVGSIVSGTFGIGNAFIVLPFSTFFFPIKEAITFVTILFISGNLVKIYLFRKNIEWKVTWLIYLGAIPLSIVGALLMVQSPALLIRRVLAGVMVIYVMGDYFQIFKNLRVNNLGVVGISAVYGFVSGFVGISGGIKAALLNQLKFTKEKFIGTLAASAILINIAKLTIYSQYELLSSDDIPFIIGLVICAFSGALIGRRLVEKIPEEHFKKGVMILLLIGAIKLLLP